MSQKPQLTIAQIADWLANRYDSAATELAPISGGFWSAAYTFRTGDDDFVLRFSDMADGFAIDAAATQFTAPDLPVPEVIDVGEALGHQYAISRRHYGRFVEDASLEDAEAVGRAMARLLAALRAVPSTPDHAVVWHGQDVAAGPNWRDFLRGGLIDKPDSTVSGWRERLAENRPIDAIFRVCESRIEELLPSCPERRDLVHGDLLHQNVLISKDGTSVTAVFSWKCSVRGDFLFDIAWCTFWGPWHPGIAAADLWRRTLHAPDLSETDLIDAPLRHHCYELQIAAAHFGWNVWTGNDRDLAAVAERAESVLERGPLPLRQST
ncbi:MAG: phosphotransferase [Verrucomicrobia bacterium]|nr:phosphotransferase [Verrucomicrobiota bacterium]